MIRFYGTLSLLMVLTACTQAPSLNTQETDRAIVVFRGGQPALVYQKAVMPPPRNASERFARSGFIHPLYSPQGALLTQIHPQGHFHHMGLWHAWVKTRFRGEPLDFWNLDKGEGGIRYKETLGLDDKGEGAGFQVLQEHYANREGQEVVVLEDTFSVRTEQQGDYYIIDYETRQTNVSDQPLSLEAYRYGGGIAYRGPSYWNADNSQYRTSEGLGREDGHASRARWVRLSGPTEIGEASLTILSHPDNPQAPQPVRIWPEGPMFFNFVPAQKVPLNIQPRQTLTLKYRLVVADEVVPVAEIDVLWRDYGER